MLAWDKCVNLKNMVDLVCIKRKLNLTFQSKLAWKILHDNNSLWTKIMKHKNLKNSKFMDYQTKNLVSPVSKSLSCSRALLNKGIHWTIGNSKNINFWWELG